MLKDVQRIIRSTVARTGRFLTSEDREDIVQSVNEKLVTHQLDRFDKKRAQLTTFVYIVARTTTLDVMRTRSRQPAMSELRPSDSVSTEDALTLMIRHEQAQVLREVIASLSDEDRTFALLCMTDGFDMARYAKQHGLTKDAVYVRKFRLLKKIGSLARNRLAA
jgi:RNA polymerase sigma factor (sigma-70 family)